MKIKGVNSLFFWTAVLVSLSSLFLMCYAQANPAEPAINIDIMPALKPYAIVTISEGGINVIRNNFSRVSVSPPQDFPTVGEMLPGLDPAVKQFKFTSAEALQNDAYRFYIILSDRVGNIFEYAEPDEAEDPFYLIYPVMDISIIKPRMGVFTGDYKTGANSNLIIRTYKEDDRTDTRESGCRYMQNQDPISIFDNPFLDEFDAHNPPNMPYEHTINNFVDKFRLTENVPPENELYAVCQDKTSGNRITQRKFMPYIDTKAPAITGITFTPPRIIELPDSGKMPEVLMEVEANEDVLCKYSVDAPGVAATADFSLMHSFIPDFDNIKEEFDSYGEKGMAINLIGGTDFSVIDQPVARNLSIICIDRANQQSNLLNVLYSINFTEGFDINVISPPRYTHETKISLHVSTSKTAACSYRMEKKDIQMTTRANPSKSHTADLGELMEGTYTVPITCESTLTKQRQTQVNNYTFVIDKTPPKSFKINGTGITCSDTDFLFQPDISFSADDANEITFYYKVNAEKYRKLSGSALSGIDADENGKPFNITGTAKFTLTAIAQDAGGLNSSTQSKTLVYDPDSGSCDQLEPTITEQHSKQAKGKVNITLFCFDKGGASIDCDESTFRYAVADKDENCTPDLLVKGLFSIAATKKVCAEAEDFAGNRADFSKIFSLKVIDECKNRKKDGDETDTDCGGSCALECGDGKSCREDSDCRTGYCNPATNKCGASATSCADKKQNGKEMGIDCGGPECPKCLINSTCNSNRDCETGYCNANSTCATASCADDVANGKESDTDCGGLCPKCMSGMKCGANSDCESGICSQDTGKCEEETTAKCAADSDCIFGYCSPAGNCELKEDGESCSKNEDCRSNSCVNGLCRAGTTPIIIPTASKFSLMNLLWIIGLALIAGGTAYLYYKKTLPKTVPKTTVQQQTAAASRGISAQELARRRKLREDAARKQQMMRERYHKKEKEREDKRTKVFETFKGRQGAPARAAGGLTKINKEEFLKVEKPGRKESNEWISLADLAKPKKMAEKVKQMFEVETKARKKPSEEFEKLGRFLGEERGKEEKEQAGQFGSEKRQETAKGKAVKSAGKKEEKSIFDSLPMPKDFKEAIGKTADLFLRIPESKLPEKEKKGILAPEDKNVMESIRAMSITKPKQPAKKTGFKRTVAKKPGASRAVSKKRRQ